MLEEEYYVRFPSWVKIRYHTLRPGERSATLVPLQKGLTMRTTTRLRELLTRSEALIVPGAYDALSARLIVHLSPCLLDRNVFPASK